MRMVLLFLQFSMLLQLGLSAKVWDLARHQSRDEIRAAQGKMEGNSWEKQFEVMNDDYVAQTGDAGLIVWSGTGKQKSVIFRFAPAFSFVHGREDLALASFAKDSVCVAWKWCKSHFCTNESGALIFNPTTKQVFRLEFVEEKGLALSTDLAKPENREIRTWLLRWWGQWPGWAVQEKDVFYKTFGK